MDYARFVRDLRAAYEHRGGIKTLHLGGLTSDWFAQIQKEARSIIEQGGSSDVTAANHVTNWTRPSGEVRQFSLFNMSGRSDEYTGDYGYRGDARKKRLVFPHFEGIKRFAALFGSSLRNLRLNGMGTDSKLSAHEEDSISPHRFGADHIVSFHLPIFTNDQAYVYLDDERFQYHAGQIYFFNHGCVHAAANFAPAARYHLVLDCFLERTLFDDLFPGSPSPDAGFLKTSWAGAEMKGEPYTFPEFVCEDGRVITGGINYGRKAPTAINFYKCNYPSLFKWASAPKAQPHENRSTP